MKVLLVRPPTFVHSLSYPGGPRFGVPVGLLYLAAALRDHGVDVEIYDSLIDFEWRDMQRNEQGYFHVGAPWERLTERVARACPDIVGISNPFADFAAYALTAAMAIRKVSPDVPIVIGGPHATVAPEFFLASESVDFVVRGEGERSFIELVKAIEQRSDFRDLCGISWKQDGELVSNPSTPFISDLDSLPLPAYDLVPMEEYFRIVAHGFPSRYSFEYPGSEREVSIVTSRGCPFDCVFCGNYQHMGKRWRYHSVDSVLRHMQLLIERYDIHHFHIEDDNLSLNAKRLDLLLEGILGHSWQITWDTPNGVRADRLSKELLRKVKRSGCTYLILGVESGNQQILDSIVKKNLKLTDIERIASICKEIRLDLHAFYIVGFPGETLCEINDTFRYAKHLLWRYDVIPHLCLARPLPGTRLHKLSEEKGYLTTPMLPEIGSSLRGEIYARQMIQTEDFTPGDLESAIARFNKDIIAIVFFKTLCWMLFHPVVWGAVLRKFKRDRQRGVVDAIKRSFFGGLFFKFNYQNSRLRRIFQDNKRREL